MESQIKADSVNSYYENVTPTLVTNKATKISQPPNSLRFVSRFICLLITSHIVATSSSREVTVYLTAELDVTKSCASLDRGGMDDLNGEEASAWTRYENVWGPLTFGNITGGYGEFSRWNATGNGTTAGRGWGVDGTYLSVSCPFRTGIIYVNLDLVTKSINYFGVHVSYLDHIFQPTFRIFSGETEILTFIAREISYAVPNFHWKEDFAWQPPQRPGYYFVSVWCKTCNITRVEIYGGVAWAVVDNLYFGHVANVDSRCGEELKNVTATIP